MGFKLGDIIGKKIVAIKDYREFDTDQDPVKPGYILFDDGETYLTLCEQDEYEYPDCDSEARMLFLNKDKKIWELLMADYSHYPDSNTDI